MITSLDEAKLLLSKWINSSTPVVAIFALSFPDRLPPNGTGLVCRLSGRIMGMDATGTFVFTPDSSSPESNKPENFLVAAIPGCGFGFSSAFPIPPLPAVFDSLPNVFPKNWDSALYIVFPDSNPLVLFAAE